MIWSQAIVKGVLTRIGDGVWSGDTFKASVIEIGGQGIHGVRVAKCLLDCMETGKEMDIEDLRLPPSNRLEALSHDRAGQWSITLMSAHLLGAIGLMVLPIRPGRVEPHAIKRRPKNHALLTVPRHIARERILQTRAAWA